MAVLLGGISTEQIEKYCDELKAQLLRARDAGFDLYLETTPDFVEFTDATGFTVRERMFMGTKHVIAVVGIGRPASVLETEHKRKEFESNG